MHLLFRVVSALVLVLVALGSPPVPIQAQQCGGPFIELTPEYGPPGTRVTINGYGFTAGRLVGIYYDKELVVTATASSQGAFTVAVSVPECCQGYHQVLANAGYTAVDTYFHVMPGLTVSPDNGPPGAAVTVKGKGFASNEGGIELLYYLDGDYEIIESGISANARGSWETSLQVPASERGKHRLDAQGAVSHLHEVADATFQVTAGASLEKSSGLVGESVIMTGSTFVAYEKGIRILFDGQTLVTGITANSKGEWRASFTVPEMPAGIYYITAEGDQTKKQDIGQLSFEIKPYLVLSDDEGCVGMELTVLGRGFSASEEVVIEYDGDPVATVESSDRGSFETSFIVPEGRGGPHLVVARDVSGNAFTAVFIMESNHPDTPALLSPANNGRVGFIGKATPTLRWSEVSDESGVWYSLQIAATPTVTPTGQFVDPLIEVSGLIETSYTLNATQALSNGIYYWIVKAVDGAENDSGWTLVGSFRVGLMPAWGFALIIVAVVVLMGALIRALLRRRSIYYDRW